MSTIPHRLFTPEEDAYIIAHYATTQLKEIARDLGREWTVVQQRRDVLAAKGRLNKNARCYHPPWTEDDEDWLADHYGLLSDAEICKHLK